MSILLRLGSVILRVRTWGGVRAARLSLIFLVSQLESLVVKSSCSQSLLESFLLPPAFVTSVTPKSKHCETSCCQWSVLRECGSSCWILLHGPSGAVLHGPVTEVSAGDSGLSISVTLLSLSLVGGLTSECLHFHAVMLSETSVADLLN